MISLRISRLPLVNQRMEYEHYKRLLADSAFRKQFADMSTDEFDCGKFIWAGKEEGASILLQRLVLGLEARIPTAVALELSCQGRLTQEYVEKLRDPFTLGGNRKGAAHCYYNLAPALIDSRFALKQANPELWKLVRTFYRDVRNPLFHGSYVTDLTSDKLDYIFSVFDQLYAWCNSWCDVMARLGEIGRRRDGESTAKI